MSTTLIVIPCYDEERRLAVDEFLAFAHPPSPALLFVDDGSRDATQAVLARMADAAPSQIDWIALPHNQGKGAAVRAGLREAIARGADIVAYLDADLATSLDELLRLLATREELDADVVLGARVALLGHEIRRSFARHYLGRVFGTLASHLLQEPVYDTQCGAKVFRVSPALEQALESPFRTSWVFDVELLGRLRALDRGARHLEVPLRTWQDVGGSKLTPRVMVRVALELVQLSRAMGPARAGSGR